MEEKRPKKLWILMFLFLTCAVGCVSSRERRMSADEVSRLGVQGRLYDVKYCPTRFDEKTQRSVVTGECESVTCVPQNGLLDCKAKPIR